MRVIWGTDIRQTNAMGVTKYDWGPRLQSEADKCWFYAISFSILLSVYRFSQLLFAAKTKASTTKGDNNSTKDEKSEESAKRPAKDLASAMLLIQLTIDCCDLMIPGNSTGWIPVDLYAVGAAQFTSSALAAQQIWRRVQFGA